ncbi:conserved hypothetical protein [Perkinsus marinus ATCC 50983]|uniref:EamA domain-containing protein n=1 Tax=Perkinsus marinus (strain ATCC 50983 / TXsc) TaxID=423536 RepID=C5KJD1_PERM5|nr:conserved hypothetical protein [Perkinsus marinus ATCC 50983]EER15433.1 conserved hypothetical protein [Perkinsus marinus ATCC 50983]|eukprot:XP_002783637.1 conserved hypothetical protein [Perkinsus marinus ATCC 50983]
MPLLVLCHITGLETVVSLHSCIVDEFGLPPQVLPTWRQFGAITVNGALGSVASDYLLSVAVILLSPLSAAVGLSLTIPLSLIVDSTILALHSFKSVYMLGSALVFAAVVLISWDTYNTDLEKEVEVTSLQAGDQGSPLVRKLEFIRR